MPQLYKLFGGARGPGKTRWLCEEAKRLSLKYKGNRGVMGRYHLSDFKNTTLRTLLECIPPELVESHNQTEHIIRFTNGSEIIYIGFSEEEAVSKVKSMDLGWYAMDEASEIPKENFLMLEPAVRRRLPSGEFPAMFRLFASNPADCWLKDFFLLGSPEPFTFIDPKTKEEKTRVLIIGDNRVFIPALPEDNPALADDFVPNLMKIYPEEWVEIYLKGSWDIHEAQDKVLPSEWVKTSVNRELTIEDKRVIACDIAQYGGDEIVIYYGQGNCVMDQRIDVMKSTMETTGQCVAMKRKHKAAFIVVEDAGMGAGVVDRLKEMGEKYLAVSPGSSALDKDHYQNLRAQMWFHARDLFKEGKVSIPNDPKLIRQLSSVKYQLRSNGKLLIEKKDDYKKRLGNSPDRADALILMLWGTRFISDPATDFRRRANLEKFSSPKSNAYGWDYHTNYPQEVLNHA